MHVSIIIVSWNVKDLLLKCIESVLFFSKNINFEIIVVDNGSKDGTLEAIKHNFPNVKLISNKKNLGFAKANNQGIKESAGEYVLLLNPDTEFIEDTLYPVLKKMESDKKIGVLGCKLLNTDKTIQSSVRNFPSIQDILVIFFKINKIFPKLLNKYLAHDFDYSKEQEVNQVMGAFFLVRKKVFEEIGLLGEKYFIWFEEVDFCRRVMQNGWKVLYHPNVKIIHHKAKSFLQANTFKKQFWFFRSALRYLLK